MVFLSIYFYACMYERLIFYQLLVIKDIVSVLTEYPNTEPPPTRTVNTHTTKIQKIREERASKAALSPILKDIPSHSILRLPV